MCLSEVYTDEDMNRIVKELPEVAPGVVRLCKLASVVKGKLCNYFWTPVAIFPPKTQYDVGFNGAIVEKTSTFCKKPKQVYYYTGLHFLFKGNPAQRFLIDYNHWADKYIKISCLLKKEWISSVGRDRPLGTTLVASQAFFPTYPATEAKLSDFLRWLKDNDEEYAQKYLLPETSSVKS